MTSNNNYILITIKKDDNEEIIFKIKKDLKFKSLFERYAEKVGFQNYKSFRFLFDGEKLNEKKTPADVGMNSGDEIEARIEQIGGCK